LDKTIRVWDAEKGNTVSGPFEGHTDRVSSVAFSPDGKYVVSGSLDKTIRVWDAEKGNTVSGPFEGHTDRVSSVAFSPDGKYVVSGSLDKTIRIWDAEKGNAVSGPFDGHTSSIKEKVLLLSDDGHISTWGDSLALSDDGWVRDINFGLLFWVPLRNRRGLVWPRTRAIMGVAVTVLDFGQFVHGSSWEQCRYKA
jgi:WD40 repeat protein